jgi:2'-5' RNA ligase
MAETGAPGGRDARDISHERGMHHGHTGHRRGPRPGGWVPVPDDPEHPRLFFAVPLPGTARDAVAALATRVQEALDGDHARVRWVRMDGLHLTLRFLGPTPVAEVDALARLADTVAARPAFEVELGGGGAFPSLQHPRTLWVGLRDGVEALAGMADGIAAAVERDGRDLETRPFAPHLTIARTDGVRAAPRAARLLVEEARELAVRFVATELILYRSVLGDGPARYEPLHAAPLGTGG